MDLKKLYGSEEFKSVLSGVALLSRESLGISRTMFSIKINSTELRTLR